MQTNQSQTLLHNLQTLPDSDTALITQGRGISQLGKSLGPKPNKIIQIRPN